MKKNKKQIIGILVLLFLLAAACGTRKAPEVSSGSGDPGIGGSTHTTVPDRGSRETGEIDASSEMLTPSGSQDPLGTDDLTETSIPDEDWESEESLEAETSLEAEASQGTETEPADPLGSESQGTDESDRTNDLPTYGENYYDLENVVLYLEVYDELPPNYITKEEARSLGWEGGSVEKYRKGAAIGGDRFGNREGLLPEKKGRSYTECDIDTNGHSSRGSRRLVFSSDGLYFYTSDHYETFTEVFVTENYEVVQ